MVGYEDYYAFWENLNASRDQYELTGYPIAVMLKNMPIVLYLAA